MIEAGIVGAGPVGAAAAKTVASQGVNVSLFEEHYEIGRPTRCAGIVSNRAIQESDLECEDFILNKVKGALVYPPKLNEDPMLISDSSHRACIVDRAKFDKKMVKKAVDNGAKLNLGHKVVDWDGKTLVVEGKKHRKRVKPSVLIGADGPSSLIRRKISFKNPSRFLKGAQVTLSGFEFSDKNYVELFLGSDFAPGFFGWVIPIEDKKNTARVGLCTSNKKRPAMYYLKKLLNDHPSLSKRKWSAEYNWSIGSIPIGPPKSTQRGRTIIVGDAAGHAKPTSGGGVYTGILCGKLAGDAAASFINNDGKLEEYEVRWRECIGRELKAGMLMHQVLGHLSDRNINSIIKKIDNSQNLKIISDYGDMDYPSKLLPRLLGRNPSLVFYPFKAMAHLFINRILSVFNFS